MMNRTRMSIVFIVSLCFSAALFAQLHPNGLAQNVGESTADRSVDSGQPAFEISASSDTTNATIKAARTISTRNLFTALQLAASAPLNKASDSTVIAAAQGFPNAFSLTGKYTEYRLAGRPFDHTDPDWAFICKKMREAAVAKGSTQQEADALDCESGNVHAFVPALLPRFEALFWDMSKAHWIWGGTGTVGHRNFEYLQTADQEKATASKTPWGASVFFAVIPPNTQTLLTVGFEYRDKYKDADAKTVCPAPGDATSVTCKTGPLGEPVEEKQRLASAEVRRLFAGRAASLKVAFDFEKDKWSADLPVYLVKSPAGALAGGIRFGWEEDKDPVVGVFVGGNFSLFPF